MRVTLEGVPVALSPLGYRLVAYLLHHKGRVVPATELLEHTPLEVDVHGVIAGIGDDLRDRLLRHAVERRADRTSAEQGRSVSVRVDSGGRRNIQKNKR